MIASKIESNQKSKRTRWFLLLTLTAVIGCFCDAVSWIFDGYANLNVFLFITTLLSMIMTILMIGVFFSYLFVYISERTSISSTPMVIGWIVVAVGVIAVIITSFTGDLFTIQNGVYAEGKYYFIYVICNTAYIVIGIIIVTVYRKSLDLYDKLAAYAYMLIPMIVGIVSIFVDGWAFAYSAIIISLLILYIMIHSDRVKNLERKGTIVSYMATHDTLTGLCNRNAYQSCLDLVKVQEENCGVVFGDLNGLKYVNDSAGHEAGDQLLIRFADILKDIFRLNEIYRISGDEFVCIMDNATEVIFRKRVTELKNILNREKPPLASIGEAYGSSKDIESLIRDAETRMYAEKKIIHEHYPEMTR